MENKQDDGISKPPLILTALMLAAAILIINVIIRKAIGYPQVSMWKEALNGLPMVALGATVMWYYQTAMRLAAAPVKKKVARPPQTNYKIRR